MNAMVFGIVISLDDIKMHAKRALNFAGVILAVFSLVLVIESCMDQSIHVLFITVTAFYFITVIPLALALDHTHRVARKARASDQILLGRRSRRADSSSSADANPTAPWLYTQRAQI